MNRILSIVISFCILLTVFANSSVSAETPVSQEHEGVVSLDGKKIVIVGNSMVYYGNCVIHGDQGEQDKGYFYQLISQNGEDAKVIDYCYPGKKLEYIYEHYFSKMDKQDFSDVDYLVLSEGNQYNDNLLGTVEKYLELFPEDVEFRFLRQPMMFEPDPAFNLPCLIEGVQTLRENGYQVVDWGKLVYDIHSGLKEVPGATLEFNRQSFMKENLGYKNGEGTVHGSGNDGDRNHQNPLSGYITAQMLYTSITNRSAIGTDYQFCYDTEIHPYFNIDNFAKVHYTGPEKTNFHEIFRSPKDMLGLQQLIDEYLILEGRHPLTVQKEVKPTCISGGLTLGSYCDICLRPIQQQEYIPLVSVGAHQLTYSQGIAPTCTKNGSTVDVRCNLCGDVLMKKAVISATGHATVEKKKRATTSSNGYINQVCVYCDEIIESEPIKKIKKVSLSTTNYTYSGKARTPSVTVTDTDGKKLKKDTDYTVTYPSGRITVGDYTVTVKFKGNYSGSKKLTFKIRPGAVSNLTAKAYKQTIKLKWDAVPAATHYRVYRYNSATKTYIHLLDTSATSCTLKNLQRGTKYKHRVTALTKGNGNDYLSAKHKYVTAITKPSTAKLSKVVSSKKKTATISWKEVARAEGYQLTYSTSKSFKSAKSVTIKGNITSKTIKKLTVGKKYYFKVCAYRTLKENVYGSYSKVKSVKIKR